MSNSLKTLISKLNDTCRRAAERAAGLCMARGNYEVDLEHLLLALLENEGCDLSRILHRCAVSASGVERELNTEIDRFKTGNTRTPVFSAHIPRLFEQAWLIASLDARLPRIRSGHLLLALLTAPELAQLARGGARRCEIARQMLASADRIGALARHQPRIVRLGDRCPRR